MTNETIIWALSPRGKHAHAYPGIRALESGVPLCGRQCRPSHVLEHFDMDNEIIRDIACPDCMARLSFMKFMKPIDELYREHRGIGDPYET